MPERSEKYYWLFSAADIRESLLWNHYQQAVEAMLLHTGTKVAPWHLIPADHNKKTTLSLLLKKIRRSKIRALSRDHSLCPEGGRNAAVGANWKVRKEAETEASASFHRFLSL